MRRIVFTVTLLFALVSLSIAEDAKPKSNAERSYFKVEVCGELVLSSRLNPNEGGILDFAGLPVARVVVNGMSMPLAIGDDKELAAEVQRLNGKLVVVTGHLHRAEARTAVQGPFVDYIRVTSLKAAP